MLKHWVLRRRDYETCCAYRREFSQLLDGAARTTANAEGDEELVFGELVTNAVRYGDEPMGVSVEIDDASLKIVVENSGRCADLWQRYPSANSEGGRGLHIVRALVSRLDIERTSEVPCRITATMPVGTKSRR